MLTSYPFVDVDLKFGHCEFLTCFFFGEGEAMNGSRSKRPIPWTWPTSWPFVSRASSCGTRGWAWEPPGRNHKNQSMILCINVYIYSFDFLHRLFIEFGNCTVTGFICSFDVKIGHLSVIWWPSYSLLFGDHCNDICNIYIYIIKID